MSSENDLTTKRNKPAPNSKRIGVSKYAPIDSEDGKDDNLSGSDGSRHNLQTHNPE